MHAIMFLLQALMHCTAMIAAQGKDRIKFSLLNGIAIALTVGFALLGLWLLNNVTGFAASGINAGVDVAGTDSSGASTAAGIMVGFWATFGGLALGFGGGILCIIIGVFTFAYGVLSELVLIVCNIVSVINPSEQNPRKENAISMAIAIAIIAAGIALFIVIFVNGIKS